MQTRTRDSARRNSRPSPSSGLLERLVAIEPGKYDVLSCYLRLEPRDRTRRKYLTELKTRIRDLDTAALPRERRLAVERDLGRLAACLDDSRCLPPARGVAIFACEVLDLFEVVPLPRVHRSRLMLDDTPGVLELVAAERELATMVVAAVDRTHARFFRADPAGATELSAAFTPSRRGGKFYSDRRDSPGWGEHRYHTRIEEERHRHYASVVEHLESLLVAEPARGFVLAGPRDHLTALSHFLPPGLHARSLGSCTLNPAAATAAEVHAAALAVAAEHDRAAASAAARMMEEFLATGWAVNGPRETLRALARGRVRTLLVRADATGAGYRCRASGRLVLAAADCSGEGEPEPVRDLVDEAVEEALRQRIDVTVVDDPAAAATLDGLAAILRFR